MDREQTPCPQHQRAAAAVWLCGLLVVSTAAGSSCPGQLTTALPQQCQQLPRVCVDHSTVVLYESKHNPRHELFEGLPEVQLKNISLDYHSFDDVWGTAFQHPGPLLRPATPGEESRELAHPQFSSCTVPLVIYANRLFHYGDFFINTVAPLYMLQVNHTLDRRLTLVVDTLGMKLQPFHRFLLSPLSAFRVTTLSHLSSRLPLARTERYSADAQHVRCFRQLLLCQMRGSAGSAARELVHSAPIHNPLWSTGQAIFSYYKRRLPAIDPSFSDKSKLKVLIAAPARSDNIRAMINQEQVWSWCRKFKPPIGVYGWNGTACLLHEFGKNLLEDLVYVSQADVLLGLHGDSLYWAFFMTKHSHVVEIRPRGFAGPQANRHMKEVTAADGDSILWWGIDIVNPAHSAPGPLEVHGRGDRRFWAHERHVFVRLMALQYVFERIALSRGSADTYLQFRERGEHHITDLLEPANESGTYTRTGAAIAAAPGKTAAGERAQGAVDQTQATPVTGAVTAATAAAAQDGTAGEATVQDVAGQGIAANAAADGLSGLQTVAAAEHAAAAASGDASAGKPQAARRLFEWLVRS